MLSLSQVSVNTITSGPPVSTTELKVSSLLSTLLTFARSTDKRDEGSDRPRPLAFSYPVSRFAVWVATRPVEKVELLTPAWKQNWVLYECSVRSLVISVLNIVIWRIRNLFLKMAATKHICASYHMVHARVKLICINLAKLHCCSDDSFGILTQDWFRISAVRWWYWVCEIFKLYEHRKARL